MAFNPDQYLAKKQSAGFDPDAYLKSKGTERPWYDVSGKGLLQGAADALPAIGAVGGGVIGGISPVPGGAFIGAGAGGVAGESLKKTIEKYLLDAPPETREKFYKDLAMTGGLSIAGEGAGQFIAGPVAKSFAGSGVKDIAQSFNRPGADAVKASAQALNVKPTQGMLTDDYIVRNLENSLSQSPSVPGSMIRSEQRPIMEAIDQVSKEALGDVTGQSEVQAGKNIKAGTKDYFEKRYSPIKDSYQEIEAQTRNVPINEKGLVRIAKNIRNLDEARFTGSDGNQVANQFADWLTEAKNVNDLKILRSKALELSRDVTKSYEVRSTAAAVVGKLEQAQANTITRQAVSKAKSEANITPFRPAPDASEAFPFAKPARQAMDDEALSLRQQAKDLKGAETKGKATGRELVGKIKSTNKDYRSLMEDARKFGKGSGLTKGKHGPQAILDDIESANPQDAASALFDSGNIEFTQWVKREMPEQFNIARQQRLSEVAQKAQDPNGSINPRKLQRLVEKMTPEEMDLLFGGQTVERLKNAGVLVRSLPEKVGASDTPRGLSFQDLGLRQNALDVGRLGLLKSKKYTPAIGKKIRGAKPYYQGLIQGGLLDD